MNKLLRYLAAKLDRLAWRLESKKALIRRAALNTPWTE